MRYSFKMNGGIKICPELDTVELNYYRKRFMFFIMSGGYFDKDDIWEIMGEKDHEFIYFKELMKRASEESEKLIQTDRIVLKPYEQFNSEELNFIANMFGDRISGKLTISLLNECGDIVHGGMMVQYKSFEMKDGRCEIEVG